MLYLLCGVALLFRGVAAQDYSRSGPCGVWRWSQFVELPEESGCGRSCTLELHLHLPQDPGKRAQGAQRRSIGPGLTVARDSSQECDDEGPLPVVFFFSGFEVRVLGIAGWAMPGLESAARRW